MNRFHPFRRVMAPILALALAFTLSLPASAFFWNKKESAAVNDFSKNGLIGTIISFSLEDFAVTGDKKTQLTAITIESLPDPGAGTLVIGGQPLQVGTVVDCTALDGLRFQSSPVPTVTTTTFTFTPSLAPTQDCGPVTVTLYLLDQENQAPIARNMELSTYKNVAITGTFAATDPEGDLITFRLVDKPKRGAVTLSEDGSAEFVYTPYENKTGKDSFTYVAVDAVGNTSAPATVKVKIEKANTKVTYADMDGVPAYRAALRLAEQGVLIGECMGGTYYFQPDLPVSRDQFVALAMHTVGLDALEGVTRTGFADDETIPTWAKGYVSAALKSGVVQGSESSEGVVFQPDATITRAEASVLLNRMLQITDATPTLFSDLASAPAWAVQAAVNLETVGVLRTNADGALALNEGLTRADAAEMLCGALEVLETREPSGWISW